MEQKSSRIEQLELGGGDNEPAIDPSSFMAEEQQGPKPTKGKVNKALSEVAQLKSREEIAKCEELSMAINRYLTSPRFEKYLQENGFKRSGSSLRQMGLQELEELLTRIKTCVANKGENNLLTKGAFFAIHTVEDITQRPGIKPKFDLQGWTEYLKADEGFMDALEAIRLETSIATALSPYQRLLFSLATSAMAVSSMNRFMAARLGRPPAPVAPAPEPAAPEPEPEEKQEDPDCKQKSLNVRTDDPGLCENFTQVRTEPEETKEDDAPEEPALSLQPGVQAGAVPKRKGGRPRTYDYENLPKS